MKKSIPVSFLFLVVLFINSTAQEKPAPVSKPARFIHSVPIQSVILKVINRKTYMGYDSLYSANTGKPSPYLSEFVGVQAIKTSTMAGVKKDFVPKLAKLVSSNDSNWIKLEFKEGYTATFYVNTSLQIRADIIIPTDHVFFEDSTHELFTAHIAQFKAMLIKNKLAAKYLVKNPYYSAEQAVYNRIKQNPATPKIETDSSFEMFNSASKNAVMLFPDIVHGDYAWYKQLYSHLEKADYDWFGLEMLSYKMQDALNDFLTAPENSPAYTAAEAKLKLFYSTAWQFRFKEDKPAEHPFISLFRLLRAKKKKVYAIENDSMEYLIFRYGEMDFGGAVRNVLWASRLPVTGKGIVFGGSAHFKVKPNKPVSFQDFYQVKRPELIFYSLTSLK